MSAAPLRACAALLLLAGCALEVELPTVLDPVDPLRYEAVIKAVDEGVFTAGTLDRGRRQSLAGSLRLLARQLEERETNELVRRFAGELRTLARMAERLGARTPIENSPLQEQWVRIRNSVFDDASWFAYGEADLHRPPPGPNPMLVDPALVAELRSIQDELAEMARELPQELARTSAADMPYFQQSWRARLTPLRSRMPKEPPAPANPVFVSALRGTEDALRSLERLPDAHRPWEGRERSAWTSLYASAAQRIERARHDLSGVQVR